MRVALVVPRYPPNIRGGGEISASLLAKAIKKYVDIEVFSFDGNKFKEKKVDGIKVNRISIKHSSFRTLKNIGVYKFLKDKIKDYDIFHTYNMDLLPAIGMLTKKYNIKSIATLNGIVFSPSMSTYFIKYLSPKFYRNKIMMRYIKNIKHFITICPYYKEKWIEDGIEENKITVIPNMIDPSFRIIENDKSDDVIRMLFTGNYAKWRNLDILLEAYSKLKYQKNIELVIVGSGWENTIKKYETKNKITYLGGVPYSKIAEIYSKCDIFVQPYLYPVPIGRVLIEALQNGLAVITTGNDDYSPIIRNMKDGILIYPMNEKELLEKMQILIENEKLRREIANNGKKRVYEICSPEKIAEKYIKAYENLEEKMKLD